jgi:hypothetical protein
VFDAVIAVSVAALVVAVAAVYGRRARTIAAQPRAIPRWAREHAFDAVPGREAVRRTGRRHGLTGNRRKLFAGVAATPVEAHTTHLLHRPGQGLWVVQHGIRNGHPLRPPPRTALGKALDYHWADAVALDLPGAAGPLLVTRRRRMRASLWLHRSLRAATGDPRFDRAFGVLCAEAAYARLVLDPPMRAWLLEQRIAAKTVLVLDGGWCYAARHEPLRTETLAARIALVTGFAERLPPGTWIDAA